MLLVVDNTPYVGGEPPPVVESESLIYIRLGSNRGLATAQNIGLRRAMKEAFTHVLLLDQDSELTNGTVLGLLGAERALCETGHKVAAVGAMYIDVKTNIPAASHRYRPFRLEKIRVPIGSSPIESDWLISSGSLIRCSILQEIGLMREELFIDVVDTEWGLRARSMGYISFLVPSVTIAHSIGDDAVEVLGRSLMRHNDVRSCYMIRNNAYLLRVPSMGWLWRSNAPLNLLSTFVTSILFSDHRFRRARLLLKAIFDGLSGKVGPIQISI
jgi:rhamnosyltransferase